MHINSDRKTNEKKPSNKIFLEYIRLCSVVLLIISSLMACSNTRFRHDAAPSRNLSAYVNHNSASPSIKVVSADTYRVCDIEGCTNNVTRKTFIQKPDVSTQVKKGLIAKLKPPTLDNSGGQLKSGIYVNRVRRRTHKVRLKHRKRKRPSGLGIAQYNHRIMNREKSRMKNNKFGTKSRLSKSSRKPALSKMPHVITKNIVGIRFKSGQSRLSQQEKRKLKSLLSRIKKSKKIYIAGYVDNSKRLSASQNKLLASKRAIAIANYYKSQGVNMNVLKVGSYGQCCFGSANDVRGVNYYYRRAEIYFSRQLLLRHASMKRAGKLVTDRRNKSAGNWN